MYKVVGIDEVGRGAWAGPLVVGAVILAQDIDGLADSKLLSAKKRVRLAKIIHETSPVGLGWVDPAEIDDIGLSAALKLGAKRALLEIKADYDEIIIDGNVNFLSENPKSRSVIKADQTVPAASAASIVAKVARDEFMSNQCKKYPDYKFDKHVGYGTLVHRQALAKKGVCPLHRKSYKPIAELI